MKPLQRKSLLFLGLAVLLGVGFAAQSYQVYRLNQKVASLETHTDTLGELASLAPATPPPSVGDPWGVFGGSDPFAGMRQLQQQMDSLFGTGFPLRGGLAGSAFSVSGSPTIELDETDEDYRVVIGVPENGELELSTDIEDNAVRVAGSIEFANGASPGGSIVSRSQFSRSIPLDEPVDPLGMRTDRDDHAIVITIPKA